jgi:hypothetical protein
MDEAGTWTTVGFIGVDSAMVWVGDPAYFGDRRSGESNFEQRFPEGWDQFVSEMAPTGGAWSVRFASGHDGLGGALLPVDDGLYAVEVRRDEYGRVAEARIVFE